MLCDRRIPIPIRLVRVPLVVAPILVSAAPDLVVRTLLAVAHEGAERGGSTSQLLSDAILCSLHSAVARFMVAGAFVALHC